MDGNGRWARSRGLERFLGHRKATDKAIAEIDRLLAEKEADILKV